jgi:hypothetical protein
MRIDYRIVDGPRGGLTFNFIPCGHAHPEKYDRDGPDVFSIQEEAFLFIEGIIANAFPDWENFGHWGTNWFSQDVWQDIFLRFPDYKQDIRSELPLKTIVRKYVLCPGLLPDRHKFDGAALLDFLDRFEARTRQLLEHYPYLIIQGI